MHDIPLTVWLKAIELEWQNVAAALLAVTLSSGMLLCWLRSRRRLKR